MTHNNSLSRFFKSTFDISLPVWVRGGHQGTKLFNVNFGEYMLVDVEQNAIVLAVVSTQRYKTSRRSV